MAASRILILRCRQFAFTRILQLTQVVHANNSLGVYGASLLIDKYHQKSWYQTLFVLSVCDVRLATG